MKWMRQRYKMCSWRPVWWVKNTKVLIIHWSSVWPSVYPLSSGNSSCRRISRKTYDNWNERQNFFLLVLVHAEENLSWKSECLHTCSFFLICPYKIIYKKLISLSLEKFDYWNVGIKDWSEIYDIWYPMT